MEKYSNSSALAFGWDMTFKNFGFCLLFMLVAVVLYIIPQVVVYIVHPVHSTITITDIQNIYSREDVIALVKKTFEENILSSVVGFIISTIVTMGIYKTSIRMYDEERGNLADLFTPIPLFFHYLIGLVLFGLIIFGFTGFSIFLTFLLNLFLKLSDIYALFFYAGVALFITTLISVLVVRFYFFGFFIVDQKMGPIKALERSYEITRGATFRLLVFFYLVATIFNFLGVLCFLVGLFITIPATFIAMGYIYRELLYKSPYAHDLERKKKDDFDKLPDVYPSGS